MQQENTISLIMFSLKWEKTLSKKREKLVFQLIHSEKNQHFKMYSCKKQNDHAY